MASSPSSTTSSSSDAHPTTTHRAPGGKPRVSAEHTLNRVRENQRRHRARRRDYIATLEQKLAETEEQLAAARAEIALLRAECGRRDSGTATPATLTTPAASFPYGEERNAATNNKPDVQVRDIGLFAYQIGSGTGADMMNLAPNSSSNASSSSNLGLALGVSKEMVVGPLQLAIGGHDDISSMAEYPNVLSRSLLDTAPASSTTYEALAEIAEPQNDISVPIPAVTGPAPCCEDTPLTPPPDPTDPECATCKTRPPPAPTESTTLCTQAYILISQQNFRNLDVATIRLWLYQGYRRAQRQGEGCRVENGVLFRLLDYISGVECDSSTHAISPCTQ